MKLDETIGEEFRYKFDKSNVVVLSMSVCNGYNFENASWMHIHIPYEQIDFLGPVL